MITLFYVPDVVNICRSIQSVVRTRHIIRIRPHPTSLDDKSLSGLAGGGGAIVIRNADGMHVQIFRESLSLSLWLKPPQICMASPPYRPPTWRGRLELCGDDCAATVRFRYFGNREVKRVEELFQTLKELEDIPDGAFPENLDTGLENTEENQDKVAERLEIEDLNVELGIDGKAEFYNGDTRIVFKLQLVDGGLKELTEETKNVPLEQLPSQVEPLTPISPAGDHSSPRPVSETHVESSAWVWVTLCT